MKDTKENTYNMGIPFFLNKKTGKKCSLVDILHNKEQITSLSFVYKKKMVNKIKAFLIGKRAFIRKIKITGNIQLYYTKGGHNILFQFKNYLDWKKIINCDPKTIYKNNFRDAKFPYEVEIPVTSLKNVTWK